MVVPSRVRKDDVAGSRIVRLAMLGTLCLAVMGGLFATSFRAKSLTNHVAKQNEISDKKQVKDSSTASERVPNVSAGGETLVLTTAHGKIKIGWRPDLSPDSVEYLHEIITSGKCHDCNFYRAEKQFLLQGIIYNPEAKVKVVKGKCPPGYEQKPDECEKDFGCGCHGPTMTHGLVAWAGGGTTPHFFIDSAKEPVTDWGQTHTVFGEIKDEDSFAVIDKIYTLPTTQSGVTKLDEKIDFTLSLE